ncbi:MAG: hypothetical protein ACJ72Z_08600 [Pyrinomonadaceae bacterium]
MSTGFSRWLAILFGVLIPLLGIVRNWTMEKQDVTAFFVDILTGTFLLFSAWKVGQKERTGRRYLAAAWGLTCGLFYSGLANQITEMQKPAALVEPTIGPEWIVMGTGTALLLALAGLITSLKSTRIK